MFTAVRITGVEARSAAERCGIEKGDTLLEIDGHVIADVLDYRFYMTEKQLVLKISRPGLGILEKTVKKREYDDLGLKFETYLMDSQRFCKNKCVFCFIDQMPENMRESLYFKDDDSRMSFLFGNYITLTNLSDSDIERIIAMRISPVNISVHTVNPELRVKMMKNPDAGTSLRFIKRLADAGIKINAQLVLCPDINDGDELRRSLAELSALAPSLQSIAAVPAGLTKFRDGLPELRLFTLGEAKSIIATIGEFAAQNLDKYESRICYAADEFYLSAGMDFPAYDSYEDFDQLENGVGLIPLLQHEFIQALEALPQDNANFSGLTRRITIATGMLAKPCMENLAALAMNRIKDLEIEVEAVENIFFGETITVAGLVTGRDLIDSLKGKSLGVRLLIPAVMLRRERDLFLDGISLDDVENALGNAVYPVENDGFALLEAIIED